MVDGFVADDLREAEKRKGSGITTGILEAGALGREYNQWRQTRYFQRY